MADGKHKGKLGGARPGAGRPKGKQSLEKEQARVVVREMVTANLGPLVEAQIKHAQGIRFLMVRAKKGGKFTRVSEEMARDQKFLESDEHIYEIWDKEPSVQAFMTLMDRAIDRPAEQKFEVDLNVKGDLLGRLIAGRKRVAEGKG